MAFSHESLSLGEQNMKKIALCALLSLVFVGCGGDDNGMSVSEICSEAFEQSYYDFSSLTQNQQKELKSIYVNSCKKYYNNLPACKSEIVDSLSCQYGYSDDYFEKHRSELEEMYNKCSVEETDEAFLNCMVKENYPCAKEDLKASTCWDKNEDILEAYEEEDEENNDIYDLLSDKCDEWGLELEDYIDDEE